MQLTFTDRMMCVLFATMFVSCAAGIAGLAYAIPYWAVKAMCAALAAGAFCGGLGALKEAITGEE